MTGLFFMNNATLSAFPSVKPVSALMSRTNPDRNGELKPSIQKCVFLTPTIKVPGTKLASSVVTAALFQCFFSFSSFSTNGIVRFWKRTVSPLLCTCTCNCTVIKYLHLHGQISYFFTRLRPWCSYIHPEQKSEERTFHMVHDVVISENLHQVVNAQNCLTDGFDKAVFSLKQKGLEVKLISEACRHKYESVFLDNYFITKRGNTKCMNKKRWGNHAYFH